MHHRFYNAKTHFAHIVYPSLSRNSHYSEYCPNTSNPFVSLMDTAFPARWELNC